MESHWNGQHFWLFHGSMLAGVFLLVSVSMFMALSTGIQFHKFSRQLSVFSLCSSGLAPALLVLSTIYLFMKVSFTPDIILCG